MQAKQLMKQPVITCRAEERLERAASLMWDKDLGALPVVDADGRLCGMITDRDICMAAYTRGLPLGGLEVQEAMSTSVLSCQGSTSLEEAERMMSDKQVRRLPIVDAEHKVVGMLTLADIAQQAASTKGNSQPRNLVQTLADISRPRPTQDTSEARAAQ